MTSIFHKLSYDPKEIIGRGGNGTTVFKGFYYEYPTINRGADHNEEKKKQVAIKRIQRSYVEGDESIIKHEVDLMITVGHHPNILRWWRKLEQKTLISFLFWNFFSFYIIQL